MSEPWYTPLCELTAKIEHVDRPGSLAGCAAARREHQGQVFTPAAIVKIMWHLMGTALEPHSERPIRIYDCAAGSGRLLWPADPDRHALYAIEADPDIAGPLATAIAAADFNGTVIHGRLEEHDVQGMDVALLNPPFSLAWDSPWIAPLPGNAFGRYGQSSSATSHWHALAQAWLAATTTMAILPVSAAERLIAAKRDASDALNQVAEDLRAVIHLPRTAFTESGADVATAIVVLAKEWILPGLRIERMNSLDSQIAPLAWQHLPRNRDTPRCTSRRHDDTQPAITLAVTGDRRIRMVKRGRAIGLEFHCGAMQAIAMNRILERVLPARERGQDPRPRGIRYLGQGWLDLENHLGQPDPVASFQELVQRLADLGAEVSVERGLTGYLARAGRLRQRQQVPMRRTAWRPEGDIRGWLRTQEQVRLTLTRSIVLGEAAGSRMLRRGTTITCARRGTGDDAGWHIADSHQELTSDALLAAGTFPDAPGGGWQVVHPGMRTAYPEIYAAMCRRAERIGLAAILTRDYQLEDCCELVTRGSGVAGWQMGLGKARLAIALCLLSAGRHNLVVVESRLLEEMISELRAIALPTAAWQVITDVRTARNLRQVNLISYNRLKQPIDGPGGRSRQSIARMLRHRIHTLVADEAHIAKNGRSDQARALWLVAPKRRFLLTGTPIANYPRDIVPLLRLVSGDGTAAQPVGSHHPYWEPRNRENLSGALRGADWFCNLFCTLEWVTNEFRADDDLQEGAKREIPKIRDLPAFRRLVSPHILRRVVEEPDVARYISLPKPVRTVTDVPWDQEHLDHYIATAEHFVHWYRQMADPDEGRINNLAMILRELNAVLTALNNPQTSAGPQLYLGGLTSKQRRAIERAATHVRDGHQVLLYAHSPAVCEQLAAALRAQGITAMVFHGGIPIQRRVAQLDSEFRSGKARVLCATIGSLQRGYNLHHASRVIFTSRDWLGTTEGQAEFRVLRPQQKHEVLIEYLHLPGSLDHYQAQVSGFKNQAMAAGLDWGEQDDATEFVHWGTILRRFVEDFETTYGKVKGNHHVA